MLERLEGRRHGFALVMLLALATGAARTQAASPQEEELYDQLLRAGARITWRGSIPLRITASIRSCDLVDEFLFVTVTDGRVSCLRADTGQLLWTRRLAHEVETLWPPVAYRSADLRAVVFTHLNDVLFVDPSTGDKVDRTVKDKEGKPQTRQVGPVKLRAPSLAPAAVSSASVFVTGPDRRTARYEIADNYRTWEIATPAPVQLAPVYVKTAGDDAGALLLADAGGLVVSVNVETRKKQFAHALPGKPTGWLATDAKAVYLATSEPRLHAIDLATGERLLEYQLPRPPSGGPVVTETSVYQALIDGGLQRVGLEPQWENWLAPEAKSFLAEWPDRVVLLRTDGRIALVKPETGETQEVLDLGQIARGVSNVLNDAVIVFTARGEVQCLQPIRAKRLSPADFRPVPPPLPEKPAVVAESKPAGEKKAEPTEGKAKPAEAAAQATQPSGPRLTPLEEILADPLRSRR